MYFIDNISYISYYICKWLLSEHYSRSVKIIRSQKINYILEMSVGLLLVEGIDKGIVTEAHSHFLMHS